MTINPDVIDTLQVTFYGLGSLTLVAIGLRRFLLERRHDTAWEVSYGEVSVRKTVTPGTPYLHSFLLILTNRSAAFQKLDGYWIDVYPDGHQDFSGQRFDAALRESKSLLEYFGREITPTGMEHVPPNGIVRFGRTMGDVKPHSAVRVCYAAVGKKRRLLSLGYHAESKVVAVGSQIVFAKLEDLRQVAPDGV